MRVPSLGLVFAAVSMAGCASLSPSAIVKLARMDPLAADPASLGIAAVMPAALKLRSGDVVLRVALKAPPPYGPIDETVLLEIVDGGAAPGVTVHPPVEHVQQARVPRRDVGRLSAALAKANAYRQTGQRDGKGSISVMIAGGCRTSAVAEGAFMASIYMRRTPDEKFFPLLSAIDVTKLLGDGAIGKLPPCDGG